MQTFLKLPPCAATRGHRSRKTRNVKCCACTSLMVRPSHHTSRPAAGRLHELNPLLRFGTLPSTLILWSMSLCWFWPITKGLLKAVGVLGSGKAAAAKDNSKS